MMLARRCPPNSTEIDHAKMLRERGLRALCAKFPALMIANREMVGARLKEVKMLAESRAAGSRMDVLDWLDGGTFIPSINEMLRPTELFVPQSCKRMPGGWDNADEALLGKECGSLIDDSLNATLLKWWLVNVSGANVPNCIQTVVDE